MSNKMTIMSGLQASGKSTRAKEICQKTGAVRVNKDDLRKMLLGGRQWDYKFEKNVVVPLEDEIVESLLVLDKDVVIDSMHLKRKQIDIWILLAEQYNAKVEVIDCPTSVAKCIERNDARNLVWDTGITRDIIINTAWRNDMYDEADRVWVGSDLDGTIADISGRRRLATKDDGKIDWKIFFDPDLIKYDIPRKDVLEKIKQARMLGIDRLPLYILSGRSDATYNATREWLDVHGIEHDRLIMRGSSDYRSDVILKEDFMKNLCNKDIMVKMFDDRPSVIRMWRSLGINVEDVGDGVEF